MVAREYDADHVGDKVFGDFSYREFLSRARLGKFEIASAFWSLLFNDDEVLTKSLLSGLGGRDSRARLILCGLERERTKNLHTRHGRRETERALQHTTEHTTPQSH